MKKIISTSILLLLFIHGYSQSNNQNINVFNIAKIQANVIEENKKLDESKKIENIKNQLYQPYENIWKGYIGDDEKFIEWFNQKGISNIAESQKNKNINPQLLTKKLHKYSKKMSHFTGYKPYGNWYIIYGTAWTNLGGLSTGEMLIDLLNSKNSTNENIVKFYPHELNHQIYSRTKPQSKTIALDRILDEGFAVYVSFIFHKNKYSLAEELGYTNEEYEFCLKNDKKLIEFLKKYYLNEDESISRSLADRSYKVGENYPGAIGYYLGLRIVQEYVKNNGKNSWKEIYKQTPLEVLNKSKILQ